MKVNNWYVYIIRCSDDSLYTGITNNIENRINQLTKKKKLELIKSWNI